jgi:hypothetical protein
MDSKSYRIFSFTVSSPVDRNMLEVSCNIHTFFVFVFYVGLVNSLSFTHIDIKQIFLRGSGFYIPFIKYKAILTFL